MTFNWLVLVMHLTLVTVAIILVQDEEAKKIKKSLTSTSSSTLNPVD